METGTISGVYLDRMAMPPTLDIYNWKSQIMGWLQKSNNFQ